MSKPICFLSANNLTCSIFLNGTSINHGKPFPIQMPHVRNIETLCFHHQTASVTRSPSNWLPHIGNWPKRKHSLFAETMMQVENIRKKITLKRSAVVVWCFLKVTFFIVIHCPWFVVVTICLSQYACPNTRCASVRARLCMNSMK